MFRLLAAGGIAAALASKSCSKSIPKDLKAGKTVLRHFTQTDSDSRLGNYKRQYYIHLPSGYTGEEKLPVLVYFHGWCDDTESDWNLASVGDKNNYILVRPTGMEENQDGCPSWNVLHAGRTDVCKPRDTTEYEYRSCRVTNQQGPCNCYTCYDDVKMFSDMMTSLIDEVCIDDEFVFATGGSNGAMFLYPLAAQLAERDLQPRLRAIAPFYGAFFEHMDDVPSSLAGTSVFAHHGLRDTEIPPAGGESDDGYFYVPIDTTLSEYASLNSCASKQTAIKTPYDGGKMKGCLEYEGCSAGSRVVRCNFKEDHGFWESYQEEMLWYFLGSLVTSTSNTTIAV